MRTRFDEQLDLLKEELIRMGALCEDAIAAASKALTQHDISLAKTVKPIECAIDAKEREIENLCMRMLLHQQPVAKDLRQISAAMKMITDMERIGDQAADISDIVCFIGAYGGNCFFPIENMARASVGMVTDSVDAFVKQDFEAAAAVIRSDDTVDHLFSEVKAELLQAIKENPENGGTALDLLMIAKYFERIADHAVNIAEWVQYSVKGVYKGEAEL